MNNLARRRMREAILKKAKYYPALKQWGANLTPVEVLHTLEMGAKPATEADVDRIDRARLRVQSGDCRTMWFYFIPSAGLRRQLKTKDMPKMFRFVRAHA